MDHIEGLLMQNSALGSHSIRKVWHSRPDGVLIYIEKSLLYTSSAYERGLKGCLKGFFMTLSCSTSEERYMEPYLLPSTTFWHFQWRCTCYVLPNPICCYTRSRKANYRGMEEQTIPHSGPKNKQSIHNITSIHPDVKYALL